MRPDVSKLASVEWPALISRLRLAPGVSADEEAWGEFIRRLLSAASVMRRLNSRASAEDVEDSVQDVALRYATDPRVLSSLSPRQNYDAYFRRVFANRALDELRRNKRRQNLEATVEEELYESPRSNWLADDEEGTRSPEVIARLRERLRSLAPEERELIDLRLARGMSLKDIAARLRLPYSTLASRWRRLMRELESDLSG